jgi:signal transduction histidine kinase
VTGPSPPSQRRFGYLAAVAGVSLAILGTFAVRRWVGPSGSLLFFPAIVGVAMYWGYGPALAATVLSTVSLAYFFVGPENSFNMGADDLVRLSAFAVVAIATASATLARRKAEASLRGSLRELETVNGTLRSVADWPVLVGTDSLELTRKMLEYAASIVGATDVFAIWEAEDEPWMYLAAPSRIEVVTKHRPDEQNTLVSKLMAATWQHPEAAPSEQFNPALAREFRMRAIPFRTEHLSGRVLFAGVVDPAEQSAPAVELVAREVGSSLDQLYLTEQMRSLAAQQERIRLARDLHDGVLQSLTGIRLQLQGLCDDKLESTATRDRLLAIERALANEQRELRLFIEDTRHEKRRPSDVGDLAQDLEEMRRRLAVEWKVPIAIRVTPAAVCLTESTCRTLKLMIHEAVINALKHARPSRVTVEVRAGYSGVLQILVVDDGHGFPFTGRLEHDALAESGSGPLSLRDRVTTLGGKLSIDSGPGGTRVEILLSLDSELLSSSIESVLPVRPD